MKALLVMAVGVPLLLAGCATRESVEQAQLTANSAEAHAADARGRADDARSRADDARAHADSAGQIGSNALSLAQNNAQRADVLEGQLKTANAKLAYLQRNVVYKKVKHKRVKHRVVHHTTTTQGAAGRPPGT